MTSLSSSSFIAVVAFLAVAFPLVQGHALWQQTVISSDGKSASTLFVFNEGPGLDQAEERFADMASEREIKLDFTSIDGDNDTEELSMVQKGTYLEAELPSSVLDGKSYVLESSTLWGVYEGDGMPPSLINFYTSASSVSDIGDMKEVEEVSHNKLMLLLLNTRKSPCGVSDEANTLCVEAIAKFDGLPLSSYDIIFLDGNTGEEIATGNTNPYGRAYISVPEVTALVFGKIRYVDETPGEDEDGNFYETVSHVATSFLELSEASDVYPKEANSSEQGDDSKTPKIEGSLLSSYGGILFVGLIAFVGSLLGGFAAAFLGNRGRHYNMAATEEDNISRAVGVELN